jgi:hypothetical protein
MAKRCLQKAVTFYLLPPLGEQTLKMFCEYLIFFCAVFLVRNYNFVILILTGKVIAKEKRAL